MKRVALALAGLMLPMAANAQVTTITGSATPFVHSSDPGLVLTSLPGTFTVDLDFNLATATPSSQVVSNLFTIGTNEGSVELGEDTTSYPLSVLFSFTSPTGTGANSITGRSSGFYQLFTSCGLIAGGCGRVVWDGPQTFNFGQGGSFSLALQNVTFNTPGSVNVGGTFTLITSAVPEPATWGMMLVGFGAVGYSMRKRSKTRARAQVA